MEFNPTWQIKNALEAAAAEKVRVEVHLKSGVIGGHVAGVGDHFTVLTRLVGKEFSDALVRLDDVCAVVAQVRTK